MSTTLGYTQQIDLTITTGASDTLLLQAVRGDEGLSRPFHFTLEMISEHPDVDFSQIVGQGATVTITSDQGNIRYIHGIMTRFVHAGGSPQFTSYLGELRPWFWLMGLASDHKIFQNQSTLDIVKAVFNGLGFSAFQDSTTGTYAAREFCVQYGETSFDFVSRLLAEEGIHYFFQHANGSHTLVLADDADAHTAITGPTAIRYKAVTGSSTDLDDVVTSCAFEQQVVPNGYALDDYEFTTPATDLSSSATGTASGSLALYDYPGGYNAKDRGSTLATLRIEAHETDATLLSGTSNVRTFTPGYTFSLTDHERSAANISYLIRSVSHTATLDSGYTNTFEAIPATVPFVPRLITRKPRIHGTQTALVVGKAGEEIWTDLYGRVTLQFHWDRVGTSDENSSCWVRVAQTWAGKSWGSLFTPRIGQEAIVSFLDGDPDRPIVIGTVYNGTQALPYTLPGDQTKSTIKSNSSKGGGGFNELRFEDKAGSEEIFVSAQKDVNVTVTNNRTVTVNNNDTLTVAQARAVTVSQGDDSYTISQGKRTLAVTAGNEMHTVGGKREVDVTGDEKHTIGGNFDHEITGNYTLKITGNLTITAQTISISANTTLDNAAGTALTNKAGSDLTNQATGTLKNTGASLSNEATADLTNKGATVTNDASTTLNNQSDGMQNVKAGGILALKGSLVQIN